MSDKPKINMSLVKNPMPSQDPKKRAHNFEEVALGIRRRPLFQRLCVVLTVKICLVFPDVP